MADGVHPRRSRTCSWTNPRRSFDQCNQAAVIARVE